ncbi:MAG: hypothetical protein QOG55_766 [Acidobacteriaceae bacterium]|jgi:hypothetical protein|nr:hypothetical protein [Acidobacteriaceae bacterium]
MAETVTRAQEAYDRGDAETLASFYAEDGVPEVAPRGTRQKRRKTLLKYGDNTSSHNPRHHHGRIDAERRTAQNGSKLPAPNKPGLCAMEGGTESKETAPVRRWRYF